MQQNRNQQIEFKSDWAELQNARIKNDTVALIKVSENCARKLEKTEASQLRRFLDEIIKVNPKIDFDNPNLNDNLGEDLIIKLSIMRPRFLYSAARKKGDLLNFYRTIFDPLLADVKRFKYRDLQYLHLFIESLIAYHKVYAKK